MLFLVFVYGVILDVIIVMWMGYVEREKALMAAITGTMVTAIQLAGFVEASSGLRTALVFLCGVFFGQILGIRLKKRLDKKKAPAETNSQ